MILYIQTAAAGPLTPPFLSILYETATETGVPRAITQWTGSKTGLSV